MFSDGGNNLKTKFTLNDKVESIQIPAAIAFSAHLLPPRPCRLNVYPSMRKLSLLEWIAPSIQLTAPITVEALRLIELTNRTSAVYK